MNKSKYDSAIINAIEQRIEDGVVFEASDKLSIANAGAVGKWLLRTGSKVSIIRERRATSDGNNLTYQAFADPTVTADGTPVSVAFRNGIDNLATDVHLFQSPTTTADGTPFPPVFMPGTAGQGNTFDGQFNRSGFIRILKPFTTFLMQITNNGTINPSVAELYLMWEELPRWVNPLPEA